MEIKICDYCSKHMNGGLDLPITIICEYGSSLDGALKQFCGDSCALIWYIKEYKRVRKKNQSIPGFKKKSVQEIAWNKI